MQRFSRHWRLKNDIFEFWSVIAPNPNEIEQKLFEIYCVILLENLTGVNILTVLIFAICQNLKYYLMISKS